jgi:hypothetical protein
MADEKQPISQPMQHVIPTGMRVLVLVLLLALAAAGAYSLHQHSLAARLTAQNAQMSAALTQTQSQIDALAAKMNTMTVVAEPAAAPAPHRPSAVVTKRASAPRVRRDDPRWKQFQAKLDAQGRAIDEQGKLIDANKQDLASAKTELSGSIARTHDELVLLQKKGERNYFEFDLDKSKQFRAQGPVSLKLKKANTKRQYADMEMIVDDATLQQKHVNLYQPVMFYSADSNVPVELVINRITKDHIHGYVSAPKYRKSELAAVSASDSAASTDAAAAQRRKLELPK